MTWFTFPGQGRFVSLAVTHCPDLEERGDSVQTLYVVAAAVWHSSASRCLNGVYVVEYVGRDTILNTIVVQKKVLEFMFVQL